MYDLLNPRTGNGWINRKWEVVQGTLNSMEERITKLETPKPEPQSVERKSPWKPFSLALIGLTLIVFGTRPFNTPKKLSWHTVNICADCEEELSDRSIVLDDCCPNCGLLAVSEGGIVLTINNGTIERPRLNYRTISRRRILLSPIKWTYEYRYR